MPRMPGPVLRLFDALVLLPWPLSPIYPTSALLLKMLVPGEEREAKKEIEGAISALNDAAELTASLRSRLKRQQEELQAALEEYQRYQALANTEREKAKAVIEEVRRSTTGLRERLIAFGISFVAGGIFFGLGVLATLLIAGGS